MQKNEIVIGIPGKWKDRKELIGSVARSNLGSYLLAGHIMFDSKKNIGYEVDVYGYDPHLRYAFLYAGKSKFSEELLKEIHEHTATVYIIADVNSLESLYGLIDAVIAVLKSGGLAVKIETTGIAHTKEKWIELSKDKELFPIYCHFVTLIGNDKIYNSFGMKSFGLPDVLIPSHISPKDAANVLNNFNLYNIVEKPNFHSGETFSIEEVPYIYELKHISDNRYNEEDNFYNPFGVWALNPKS